MGIFTIKITILIFSTLLRQKLNLMWFWKVSTCTSMDTKRFRAIMFVRKSPSVIVLLIPVLILVLNVTQGIFWMKIWIVKFTQLSKLLIAMSTLPQQLVQNVNKATTCKETLVWQLLPLTIVSFMTLLLIQQSAFSAQMITILVIKRVKSESTQQI